MTKGTAPSQPDDTFRAKPSKMWLYVGRALETVTERDVLEHLRKGCRITSEDEIVVKRLASKGRSSAFQVGIDPGYYSQVLRGEFWPAGIVVRKFIFRFANGSRRSATMDQNFISPTQYLTDS